MSSPSRIEHFDGILLILASPAALLMWLRRRFERREEEVAERRYAEIKAAIPTSRYAADRSSPAKATSAS